MKSLEKRLHRARESSTHRPAAPRPRLPATRPQWCARRVSSSALRPRETCRRAPRRRGCAPPGKGAEQGRSRETSTRRAAAARLLLGGRLRAAAGGIATPKRPDPGRGGTAARRGEHGERHAARRGGAPFSGRRDVAEEHDARPRPGPRGGRAAPRPGFPGASARPGTARSLVAGQDFPHKVARAAAAHVGGRCSHGRRHVCVVTGLSTVCVWGQVTYFFSESAQSLKVSCVVIKLRKGAFLFKFLLVCGASSLLIPHVGLCVRPSSWLPERRPSGAGLCVSALQATEPPPHEPLGPPPHCAFCATDTRL